MRHSPAVAAMWAEPAVAVPLPPTSFLYAAIDDSLHRVAALQTVISLRCEKALVGRADTLVLPGSAAEFVQHYRSARASPIQHSITHRITTLCGIARVCEARMAGKQGVATVARLLALREPGSALWLQTLPTGPGLTLTDVKWLWAAQLRLGVPVPVVSSQCDACKAPSIYTTDSWHSLTCVSRSGTLITRRHNSVLDVVAKYCKLIDVAVTLNPASESHLDDRRADVEVYLPDRTIVGDVTVSHPSTKTWRKKVARSGVHVVGDAREAAKVSAYQAMAALHDKEFQAIVMYTYGGLHPSAKRFLKAICDSLDPALCLLSHSDFKAELHAHIAIALQRGNAAIMIEDDVRTRMNGTPHMRRHCTAAKRVPPPAMATGDSDVSSRGVGEDGAWLMRGARASRSQTLRAEGMNGGCDTDENSGCADAAVRDNRMASGMLVDSGGAGSGVGGAGCVMDAADVGAATTVLSCPSSQLSSSAPTPAVTTTAAAAVATVVLPGADSDSDAEGGAAAASAAAAVAVAAAVRVPPTAATAATADAQLQASTECASGDVSDVCMSDGAGDSVVSGAA